jgi:hypothetical protein
VSEYDPWRDVARRVLKGEFDSADESTRESIRIGLRNVNDPITKRALARIAKKEKDNASRAQ